MKTLYCDASFDWVSTEQTTENVVRGKICVVGDGIERVEKVAIGKVDGLKQYINVLELTAIARAIEIAASFVDDYEKKLTIFTDSQTAMYWARAGKIKNKKVSITLAHESALEYLNRARTQFGGEITIDYVRRENNLAGKVLEVELDNGNKPHDL